MAKPIHVAVIYNEPTVETEEGRKFAFEINSHSLNGNNKRKSTREKNSSSRYGGNIDLSEVGVLEQKEDIEAALRSLGYETSIFNMSDDLDRFLAYLKAMQPDIIFNMVESLGEDAIHEMHVAGVYELLDFQYTGAGPLALGTCLNKARTKEILSYNGIPTARFLLVENMEQLSADDLALKFPIIVKPSAEDASVGIESDSIVNNFKSLAERAHYILTSFKQPALIEEYIDGRELNVGILGNNPPVVLPISEIDFSELPSNKPKIVTYNAKWMEGTDEYRGTNGVCPAILPAKVEAKIKEIALKAFHLMGCRDYARVDMRLTPKYEPYVLEVNPNPDLSDDAGFYRSAKTYGMSYTDLVGTIVGFALERLNKKK